MAVYKELLSGPYMDRGGLGYPTRAPRDRAGCAPRPRLRSHARTGSPLAAEALRYWPYYARYRFDKVVSIVPRADMSDD